MNSHLNLFKTYSRKEEAYRLENDLTRAVAICLQEEPLFLFEFLKSILGHNLEEDHYDRMFSNEAKQDEVLIDIQQSINDIGAFEHLYAVGISGKDFDVDRFFEHKHDFGTKRITDLFIRYRDVVIICELKRDSFDLSGQLYNQAMDAVLGNITDEENSKDYITPVDLPWPVLMEQLIKVANFQAAVQHRSRFLEDFIKFVKRHNSGWLPVIELANLEFEDKNRVLQRIDTALNQTDFKLEYNDRIGLQVDFGWASEIILSLGTNEQSVKGLNIDIWPGNTKQQGWKIFSDSREPQFKNEIRMDCINGDKKTISKKFHLKITNSHGKYITGMTDSFDKFAKPLYTYHNFSGVSGRQLRGNQDWLELQQLFDEYFIGSYDWRSEVEFEKELVDTNYSRFNLAFGYNLNLFITFEELQSLDREKENMEGLISLFKELRSKFAKLMP